MSNGDSRIRAIPGSTYRRGAVVPPLGTDLTVFQDTDGSLKQVNSVGVKSALGGGSATEDAWFSTTAARISTLVATLTNVVQKDDLFNKNTNWDSTVAGSGTVTNGGISALDLQNGTTAASNAVLTAKGSFNSNPNLRTTKSAFAVRIKKIANIATSDHRIGWSDGANPVFFGIQGATSQLTYSIKVGTGAIVDTLGVQSTTDYDTVILVCDGTNYFIDLNGAIVAASVQAVGTAPAAAGTAQILVTHNATANDGLRIDKTMIVGEQAS